MEVTFYDKHGKMTGMDFSGIFSPHPDRRIVQEVRKKFEFPFVTAEYVQLSARDMDILYGGMQMKEQQTAHFNHVAEPEHIEMHFTLAGEGLLENHINGKKYRFSKNEQNLHYMPNFIGSSQYAEGSFHKFFEIRFTKKRFLELAEDSSPVLMDFADKVANNKMLDVSAQNLPITFAMHQCINEIMHVRLADGLKRMFLQSKCIELLSLQTQAYEDSIGKTLRPHMTTYDKERIHFVRDYLIDHVACPPSLSELAKIAGLNEFKLKKGFKEVFNTTVFGYLSDFKLNDAKNELLSGAPIKEVSEQLGYSSVQHFTRAFKEKFGMPPGRIRKN